MLSRFQPLLKVLCALAIVGSSGVTYAQFGKPGAAGPARVEPEPFRGKGKVAAIVPDGRGGAVVLMTNEKSETWALKFSKSSKLRVKGKANLDVLSMGMVVRFDAMFDKKKGQVKDPVNKLLVCGDFPEYTLGPFEDPTAPVAGGQLESDYKSTQLTGKLIGVKGTSLMMMMPGTKVRFEVTEDVQVDCDLNFNPRWDYTGDEIDVNGTKAQMPQMPAAGGMGQMGQMGHNMPRGRAGRGPGRPMPGQTPQGAGGAPGAAPAGGEQAAGGFGGAPAIGMPVGLVNVREATILKNEFNMPGRGHKTGEKPAKPE